MAGESNVWITPDGLNTISLNGTTINGLLALDGRQGIYLPPVQIQDQTTPLQPGSTVRYINYPPRPVLLPLLIKTPDEVSFVNQVRTLGYWFDTPAGSPGTYRRTAPDGSMRDLFCYYQGGLEFDETMDSGVRGPGWAKVVLSLYAADPFWYDSIYTTLTFVPSGAAPALLPSLIPIKLGFGGILSSFLVSNAGDFEAWPVWTIHGPGVNPVLSNTTTGKTTTLTVTLGSSDVLVIDTRPGVKNVTLNGTTNWSIYNPASSLWSFSARNLNTCGLSMTGTGAGSQVILQYKQRYKAA